jgi:hypothetical protein
MDVGKTIEEWEKMVGGSIPIALFILGLDGATAVLAVHFRARTHA